MCSQMTHRIMNDVLSLNMDLCSCRFYFATLFDERHLLICVLILVLNRHCQTPKGALSNALLNSNTKIVTHHLYPHSSSIVVHYKHVMSNDCGPNREEPTNLNPCLYHFLTPPLYPVVSNITC